MGRRMKGKDEGRGALGVLSGAESFSFGALMTRQDYSSFEVISR